MIQGVLFAHRTVQHTSTKCSPFYVLYQREAAVPPVGIKHSLQEDSFCDDHVFDDNFDEDKFEETLRRVVLMRGMNSFF